MWVAQKQVIASNAKAIIIKPDGSLLERILNNPCKKYNKNVFI